MILKKMKYAAAALAVSALMAAPGSAATNLLVNGSFEDTAFGGNWSVFDAINGWTKTAGTAGIEIQKGGTGGSSAYHGNQKVELDSHNFGPGPKNQNSNSGMTQTVSGLSSGTYEFSFAYRGRTNDADTNGIAYSIFGDNAGGILDATITGIKSDGWQIISYVFTLGASDDLTIGFNAFGREDTLGGFIDDVKLSAVPLPAALPLYGAGLAAMGLIGWRRKRKAAAAA